MTVAVALASALPATALAAPISSVNMVSQSGDYIGEGLRYLFDPATGTVTLGGNLKFASVEVTGGNNTFGWGFALEFAPPSGAELKVGEYIEARRFPFEPPSLPGLTVSGDGRGCNQDFGRFLVKDIHADTAGKLDRLWLLFEQHCESPGAPALFGEVRVGEPGGSAAVAAEPGAIAWPQTEVGEPGTVVPVSVIAGPAGARVSAVAIAGTDPGDFHVTGDECVAATLLAAGRCHLNVGITPMEAGDRNAELDITDSEGKVTRVLLAMITMPSVASVTPALGPKAGGTSVTIHGGGFAGASAVAFGSTPAASFTVDSPTEITATSPPGSVGPVDVTVTSPRGTSPQRPADVFHYATVPGAPSEVSAVAESGQARVSFSAPDAHGSPIIDYTVEASPGGAKAVGIGSPVVVTGLTAGATYTFTVRARNAMGTGPASAPSNPVTITISEPTTISILASPSSSIFGALVTYDALVAAASVPTGTVQFSTEGFELGPPEPLNELGRLAHPPRGILDVGTTLTASYSGDPTHAPSETSQPLEISPATTSVSLTSSANPQAPGTPVTITATVFNTDTLIVPFGAVQFVVNGRPVLEPLPLSPSGRAGIIGRLPAGVYTIDAEYHDDTAAIPDFKDGRGSLTQVVSVPPPPPLPPLTARVTEAVLPAPPVPAPAPATGGTLAFNAAVILGHPSVSRSGRISIAARTVDPGRFTVVAHTRQGYLSRATRTATAGRSGSKASPAVYGASSMSTPGAKAVTLVVAPDARARRALSEGRTLHLTILVTFQSSRGGGPSRMIVFATVKRPGHRRSRS